MQAPTIDELDDRSRFEPLLELAHANLTGALRPHLFDRSPVIVAYWGANALALGLLAWLWLRAGIPFLQGFPTVSLGMAAGWAVLLPVHEHIHAALYRAVGAGQVRVVYQWRHLMAYCLADRQVVGGRDFLVVCLGPFVVLNALLAAAVLAAPPGSWQLAFGGALVFHVGATSGDIALANGLWRWRGRRVWTYDDAARGLSFFFAEETAALPPMAPPSAPPK